MHSSEQSHKRLSSTGCCREVRGPAGPAETRARLIVLRDEEDIAGPSPGYTVYYTEISKNLSNGRLVIRALLLCLASYEEIKMTPKDRVRCSH